MKNRYFKPFLILNVFFLMGIYSITLTHAQEVTKDGFNLDIYRDEVQIIQLVQNTNQQPRQNPPSGNQLFPSANDPHDREGKKCMTVCARWGEECTFTDRGAGGTTRDCRRTCQQFTEECF